MSELLALTFVSFVVAMFALPWWLESDSTKPESLIPAAICIGCLGVSGLSLLAYGLVVSCDWIRANPTPFSIGIGALMILNGLALSRPVRNAFWWFAKELATRP